MVGLHYATAMDNLKNTSALSTLQKLSSELPTAVRSADEFQSVLNFLNLQLPFARFALARANQTGELPSDQYHTSAQFPVYHPKTLESALNLRQSQIDPMNSILVVPCIQGPEIVGVLLANKLQQQTWSDSEVILVEIAAQEVARSLVSDRPGLTINPNLKNRARNTGNHGISSGFSSAAPTIIGSSEKLKSILSIIDRVAPTQASVLILGESGSGKELVARRIHALSDRKNAPFVAINCGAITENLLESELFGHEKGSFTGASVQKKGLVEIADGGTLFLDEIGEMALFLQAKMLRFLQEGEFYRVGGKEPLHVSVRIISATNRDLDLEVRNARFREDLFYRLNTISLKAPSLRERKDDIPLLMDYFSPGTTRLLSPDALEAMKNYPWPGNIRELQNMVERLRILSGGSGIGIADLPNSIRHAKQGPEVSLNTAPPVEMKLEELERIHILRCLNHFEGNKTRAALSLGITIKTLYNKLHRYGILDKSEANQ
jgi:DNA-binding NtrC family response regulator